MKFKHIRGTNKYKRVTKTEVQNMIILGCFLTVLAVLMSGSLIGRYKAVQEVNAETKAQPLKSPIVYASESAVLVKEATKEDIINTYPHADIIMRIWNNETSKGQNNTSDPTALHMYCRAQGKTNEFGYDPQDKFCFATFEDSVKRISQWLDACLSKNTLAQCLESYSGNSESYITKFLNQ